MYITVLVVWFIMDSPNTDALIYLL